ncbi:MAG: hypothetical protein DRO88_06380 [Promethearchaeia archaeon]|nr:MAG: hypothetical protein DRO88_06380 [Candidatus Lokiarchaeia archaeon]
MEFTITNLFSNETLPGSNFQGGHGQSFHIKVSDSLGIDENKEIAFLFDVGASSKKLLHNMHELGISPFSTHTILLSHGHYDHTDALPGFLSQFAGDSKIKIICHPAALEKRFFKLAFFKLNLGFPRMKESLLNRIEFNFLDKPFEVFPNLWFSGEIEDRPYITGVEPKVFHSVLSDTKNKAKKITEVDPVRDDASLYLLAQKGIVILAGCGHAGILNIARHAKRLLNVPIHAIIGGSHMVRYSTEEVEEVASILKKEFGNPILYLNHCTNHLPLPLRNPTLIFKILKENLGEEKVLPCYVGSKFKFSSRERKE